MSENPKPTEWHRSPEKRPCPVCGLSSKGNTGSEHRQVAGGWQRRRKTSSGWEVTLIPADHSRKPYKSRVGGPTPKTCKRIAWAAQMRATGHTMEEIASKLEMTVVTLASLRRVHAKLWESAEAKATEEMVGVVRQLVATDAIQEDVTRYLAMAGKAKRWCEDRGETLFPVNGKPTLCTFYREYYRPTIMADPCPEYCERFEAVLRTWELMTGDPCLVDITPHLLGQFRDAMANHRGQKPGSKVTARTVKNYLEIVQRLLDHAGPPGRGCRAAAGILDKVPWVKPPRQELKTPRIVSPELIGRMYRAAGTMDTPVDVGVNPGRWWEALIVVVWNTGIRRRTLFELEWSDVDFERLCLNIPPQRMKSKRGELIHLNATAIAHLRTIQRDEGKVFPWPHCPKYFHQRWSYVLDLAGIARKDQFTPKHLRQTLATAMCRTSPQAAQLALGHANFAVTQRHYIQSEGIVAEALDSLPQPEAFSSP